MHGKFSSFWLLIPVILVGCSARQHQKKADAQVYQILKKAEKHVFGKSRGFTIDTKYSGRKTSEFNIKAMEKREIQLRFSSVWFVYILK